MSAATLHTNQGAIAVELFDDEALVLLRHIVDGLESGALAPTASAIEPLADTLPA